MKRQLESLICDTLKERVSYFATTYRRSDDGMGRACIMADGAEVVNCSYINQELNWYKTIQDTNLTEDAARDVVRENGIFSSYDFYNGAKFILNESIDKCLASKDELILSMALIDRRTGKRALKKFSTNISARSIIAQYFYKLRCEAEGMR